MRKVLVESRYAGDVERNVVYLRAALRDCFERGEAPFASHAIYTQPGVLNDDDANERMLGIDAGLLWGFHAEVSALYVDYGISSGMAYGIKNAKKQGRPVEIRSLPQFRNEDTETHIQTAKALLEDQE